MSKFQTSYNAYIIPADNIPHEETKLVSRTDFRVEDAPLLEEGCYIYVHKGNKAWEMIT